MFLYTIRPRSTVTRANDAILCGCADINLVLTQSI